MGVYPHHRGFGTHAGVHCRRPHYCLFAEVVLFPGSAPLRALIPGACMPRPIHIHESESADAAYRFRATSRLPPTCERCRWSLSRRGRPYVLLAGLSLALFRYPITCVSGGVDPATAGGCIFHRPTTIVFSGRRGTRTRRYSGLTDRCSTLSYPSMHLPVLTDGQGEAINEKKYHIEFTRFSMLPSAIIRAILLRA